MITRFTHGLKSASVAPALMAIAVVVAASSASAQGLTGRALTSEGSGYRVWGGVCLDSPSVESSFSQVFTSIHMPAAERAAAQCAANAGELSMSLRHHWYVGILGDWEVSWTAYVSGDANDVNGMGMSDIWSTSPPEPFSEQTHTVSTSGATDDEYPLRAGIDVATITVGYATTRSATCTGAGNHNFAAQDYLNESALSTGGVYLWWPASYTGQSCILDSDDDLIENHADNCTLVDNADQRDTDGDGYGNVCDPDLNGDRIVNFQDVLLLKQRMFSADPDADFNGDGIVNFQDVQIAKEYIFGAPGPSGVAP